MKYMGMILGICCVIGTLISKILMEWICAFYITVIRSWKGNVRKLVDDKDHSSEIYQTLNILMIEPTPEKFCVLGNFEDKWTPISPSFMAYFKTL